MKKIFSLTLVVLIIASVLFVGTITVSAATSGTTGDCFWSLDGTVLTISGEGEMKNYSSFDDQSPWGTSITQVVIEEGVKNVATCAFSDCENLAKVSLPSSIRLIGCGAFENCTGLLEITIPYGVAQIDNGAFKGCSSLTSVTFPETLEIIGNNTFEECRNLSDITLPDSVTQIGNSAFNYTKWYDNQPRGVLYIGKVLYGYKYEYPQELVVKDGTLGIASEAFIDCLSLKKVIVPASVDFIGHRAFSNTGNLEHLTIADSDIYIDFDAFADSLYYKTEDNWENGVLYIDNHLIKAKNSISGFYEIKEGTKTIARSAFSGCSMLTDIYIPESVESIGDSAFYNTKYYNTKSNWENGALYNGSYLITATKVSFEHYTVKPGTKVIADFSFYCSAISSITLPKSINLIGGLAFYRCDGLSEVYYEGTDFEKENIVIREMNYQLSQIPWRHPTKNDWVLEDGKWAFYEDGLKLKNCWKEDTVGWVYIGEDGYMMTNAWMTDSVGWCYLGDNGYCVTNAWRKDSKGWVYLDEVGRMKTNAWVMDSVGWCYVGEDGYAVTNCWKQDSVGWCYLNSNGSMTKNSWVLDGGKWYYLNENGYMVSDKWQKDSIGWVYLGSNGAMVTDAWLMDSVGWCYVGSDGYAVTNCFKQDSYGWCYFNSNGSMVKNAWVLHEGKWYYLDENGYRVTDSKTINGKLYYFNSDGSWSGDNQSMDGFGPWQ